MDLRWLSLLLFAVLVIRKSVVFVYDSVRGLWKIWWRSFGAFGPGNSSANRPRVDASERKPSRDVVQEVQEWRPQTHQLERLVGLRLWRTLRKDPYTAQAALCKKSRV